MQAENTGQWITIEGIEAASVMAHKTNEVIAIYPTARQYDSRMEV